MTAPLLYTPAEAADLLKVKESHLRREVTARAIPHTRIGRRVLFSEQNLADIVAAGQQRPARGLRGVA